MLNVKMNKEIKTINAIIGCKAVRPNKISIGAKGSKTKPTQDFFKSFLSC